MGVQLAMVSIGRPEKGKQLMEHLGIMNGDQLLFVDPENVLYDALDLNRGIYRTFFNMNTPLAFLDRFTRDGGTKELGEILPKWTKGTTDVFVVDEASIPRSHLLPLFAPAFYIPPKQEQALRQGGTFVFRGSDTLFAHYDPSTASHASIDRVMEIVKKEVKTITAA